MPNGQDNRRKQFADIFSRFVLPAAGIAETIATKGASPGTTALQQQRIFQEEEERRRQAERELQQRAMQQKLFGLREREVTSRELAAGKPEMERKLKLAEKKRLTDLVGGLKDLTPSQQALGQADPTALFKMLSKPQTKSQIAEVSELISKLDEFGKKKRVAAGIKQEFDIKKIKRETTQKFNKVKNLMKNLWRQKKGQLEEGGVLAGGGIVKGTLGKTLGTAKVPGFEKTAAYEGQVTETATALNSILTGQNRVIESVLQLIIKTLPDIQDTESFAAFKIEQSIRNSLGMVKAMNSAGLDTDAINQLPTDELSDINSQTNQTIQSLTPSQLDEEEEREADKIISDILGFIPSKQRKTEGVKTTQPVTAVAQQQQTNPAIQELIRRARAGDTEAQQGLRQAGISF